MTRALLLSFSPHGKAAQTFKLARALLRDLVPDAEVTERDYGAQALPPLTREYANALTTPGAITSSATALSEQVEMVLTWGEPPAAVAEKIEQVPTQEAVQKLTAARLAADVAGTPTIILAASRHRTPPPCCVFAACWKPIN